MISNTDEDKGLWNIPGSDTKGHSVKKAFRITPQLEMQIEMVLNSKKFPYRTEAELLRHALVKLLKHLDKKESPKDSIMPQIMNIINTVRREEENREFSDVIGKVVNEVSALIAAGNGGRAKDLLEKVLENVDQIQDVYWKEKYKNEIVSKVGHTFSSLGVRMRVGLKPSGYKVGDN
jgi:hypothetical protein